MKKLSSMLLALALILSLAVAPAQAAESRVAIDPDAPASRGAVIQTLYEREGQPMVIQSVAFADAAGTWYANAAVWAKGAGIISGDENGRFDGARAVTRAELAVILYRYAVCKGMDVSAAEDTNILSYDDAFITPDWAMGAFQFTCAYDVLAEKNEGGRVLLAAGDKVTYAELASALKRMDALADPLSLWTEDAAARKALLAYMEAVTDESGKDFIPVEDRIAVFDLDGTLFCETDPNYFDYTLLKYRVLEDPTYKDKASDFEKEVANKIKEQNETGKSFSGLEVDHGKAVASAFAGMTLAEFNAYIQEFKKQTMPSYDGMLRGEGWYEPMLQVVSFLQANDFTVYIVSGTDRLIVRGIAYNSPLGLPDRQIIGSDELLVASHQGNEDGLKYTFTDQDELILGGEFLIKNLKTNKVTVIAQEIGQQPVLSFGNSTGDASMAEYVTSDNKYQSLAFMLCCDDTVRENGNESKAQKMFELCEEFDWVPVSMKNDWTTIYGEGVTKK